MVRPKKKGPKAKKVTISFDPELFDWVEEKVKIKRFSSRSHAVNESLLRFKKEMDSEK